MENSGDILETFHHDGSRYTTEVLPTGMLERWQRRLIRGRDVGIVPLRLTEEEYKNVRKLAET
jgi:hypothetical protein